MKRRNVGSKNHLIMEMGLILGLYLALLLTSASGTSVSWNDDVLGLLVFKSGIQDPLGSLASWNEADSSPCNWTGIRCESVSGRVESVSLNSLSLSGSIGRGLLKLERLRTLSLSNNNISGCLVPELLQGSRLEFVDLKNNHIGGSLPPLGASVRYVDLSQNALSGSILGEFLGQTKLLRFLSLSKNRLSGELPQSLRNQTGLITLRMAENGFSGELPDWIGTDLQALQDLDLSWNEFLGPIPSSLATIQSLRSLSLAGNKLNAGVPQGFLELLRLSSLDLSSNSLSGRIPSGLFSSNLQLANFSGNEFIGDFPIWPPCHSLQVVDLSENKIEGALPARLGECFNVQHLNLASNLLVDGIPSEISQLQKLMFLDLSHNRFSGAIPSSITNVTSLTVLRLEKNALTGTIPAELCKCERLMELDLSSNRLSGNIPTDISKLSSLHSLDLSWNNLSGSIPKEFTKLASLGSVDVSHNHLDGPIPKGGVFNVMNRTSFQGNPGLCGSAINVACSMVPKPIVLNPNASGNADGIIEPGGGDGNANRSNRKNKIVLSVSAIIAISAAAVIALGIVVVSVLNIHAQAAAPTNSKALMADSSSAPSSPSEDLAIGKLVMFTDGKSQELLPSAQALLNKDQEVGRGSFGVVYRAALADGRVFAVKKLVMAGLMKPQLEFEKEVQQLGRVQHPNLVALQGYYWTSRMQLLIYDFIPKGSLYSRLHERTFGDPPLCWSERFRIALGAARGLSYLHNACQPQIIHYDLKSSNILIGSDHVALISDYGLATLLPVLDRYAINNKFQGALGYMAPEFACQSLKVSDKCDVYSFGIILLELVTGRRPVEYMEDDVFILCDYVRALVNEGRALSCLEPGLEDCPEDELLALLKLGLICSSPGPSARPSMAEVVQILELVRPLGSDIISSSS